MKIENLKDLKKELIEFHKIKDEIFKIDNQRFVYAFLKTKEELEDLEKKRKYETIMLKAKMRKIYRAIKEAGKDFKYLMNFNGIERKNLFEEETLNKL